MRSLLRRRSSLLSVGLQLYCVQYYCTTTASAATTAATAAIDRAAISRSVKLLGVRLDARRTGAFIDNARPHVLKMRGVRAVVDDDDGDAKGDPGASASDQRVVLLSERLKLGEHIPDELQYAISAADGELTSYEVTLGYDELSAHEVLRQMLPADVVVPTSYEEVGHIVHFNLKPEQRPHRFLIGQVLLDKLTPRIRTVVNKAEEISSQFRNLPLELIAGDDDFTVCVQHGAALLSFDYSKVYWSSRLQTEHEHIASSFAPGAHVWDLFAGVGPFAVLAAQHGVHVLANDLNPDCADALVRNVAANRVDGLVRVYNLDAAEFVQRAIESTLVQHEARSDGACATPSATASEASWPDHILLNLPADSLRFLTPLRALCEKLGREGELPAPRVHCYSFTREEEPEAQLKESEERVASALGIVAAHGEETSALELTVRTVRSVAPGKTMLCLEFPLPRVSSSLS